MNIDIKTILATGERVMLECKKAQHSVPNSLWDTYSAFANTYGGTILLGVGIGTFAFCFFLRPATFGSGRAQKLHSQSI